MSKLVFGLGTGRCGTVSLTELLDSQKDVQATHELIITPWKFSQQHINSTITALTKRRCAISCDVSFWHLPYVEYILDKYTDAKFVCLERDKEATVISYNNKTGPNVKLGKKPRNHWTDRNSQYWEPGTFREDPVYDKCYPKYDLPKLLAIEAYWVEYYEMSQFYENKFPENFRVYKTEEVLNDAPTQKNLLTFVGISEEDMIVRTFIHKNKTKQG